MKKFIIALVSLTAVLALAVGITFAFFSEKITSSGNTVASGTIRIKQLEQEHDANGTLKDFTQGQQLRPGAYIEKIVTVSNTGINPAYVRTCIAVPNAGNGNPWIELDTNQSDWTWQKIENVAIDGVNHTIFVATYTKKLSPEQTTSPSIQGFGISPAVDFDGTNFFYVADGIATKLDLSQSPEFLVATEAVQTATFSNAKEALQAAFGDITASNNPWDGKPYLDVDTLESTVVYETVDP